MGTIQEIGIADFEQLLAEWRPRRQITEFHVHHTWRPRRADFRGRVTIEAMRRYHMEHAGMADIAQHLTVDPAGRLWTGRPFDRPPASIRGANGSVQRGPFMIEMIGDFDRGQDVLDGAQKHAVQAVILAVLRKFGLDESAIRFHNEKVFKAGKTCPGSSLDLAAFRGEIRELLSGARALELPMQSDARLDAGSARAFDTTAPAVDLETFEAPHAEVPERRWMLRQQEFLTELMSAGGASAARGAAVAPQFQSLLPYVINLSKGVLSTQGEFHSSNNSLRAIVDKHLPEYLASTPDPQLVFYAHGGLVDEGGALRYARTVAPWWLAHGVYPLFFIWESGFFETLRQQPRAFGGFGEAIGEAVSSVTDKLAESVIGLAAAPLWAQIKRDAENASAPLIAQYGQAGGAYQLAQALLPLLDKHRGRLRLHAIGHSTGPILLARFLPMLTQAGHRIETLSYLAPAIRIDRFKSDVLPHIGGDIGGLSMYTMTDEAERADQTAQIYRKSLLYFVREGCEGGGRVLGLAADVVRDAELRARFGLPAEPGAQVSFKGEHCTLELSPAPGAADNPNTAAQAHGAFDNDARTMTAVLGRILGRRPVIDTPARQYPSLAAFERAAAIPATRAVPASSAGLPVHATRPDMAAPAESLSVEFDCPHCGEPLVVQDAASADSLRPQVSGFEGAQATAAEVDYLAAQGEASIAPGAERSDAPFDEAGIEFDRQHAGAPPRAATVTRGPRRIALCVGINSYGTGADGRNLDLKGCVDDSTRWAKALRTLGFEVLPLLHERQATRRALVEGLRGLIRSAKPGDELVFQFAGHGAQVKDVSGDEADSLDEAWVPADFRENGLLYDDDIYLETLSLNPQAYLTLFLDSCHSGSSVRMLFDVSQPVGENRRARFIQLADTEAARMIELRRDAAYAPPERERHAVPGVIQFAACMDRQCAYETDREGDFTRHALPLLEQAGGGLSNDAFIREVERRLASPVQTPFLLPPAGDLAHRPLLGLGALAGDAHRLPTTRLVVRRRDEAPTGSRMH